MRLVALVAFSILYLSACSQKTTGSPTQLPSTAVEPQPDIKRLLSEKSAFVINYSINNKGIIDTFEYIVDSVFKEEWILEDYGLTAKLKRTGPMNVEIVRKEILVELPISIEIKKETILGKITAKGTSKMRFVSNIDIDTLWVLRTKTKLVSNEWIDKPNLNIGINLPITTISDRIFDKVKPTIEQGIDQSIRESFNLRTMIIDVTKNFSTPYQLHNIHGGWFYMMADSTYLSPIINKQGVSQGKIKITAKTIATSQKPGNEVFAKIPKVKWESTLPDQSKLVLQMDLSYAYLDSIANAELAGKTFEEGGKKITVKQVRVSPSGQKLQIATLVSGSVDGEVITTGVPYYEKSTRTVKIKDMDFAFKTKNILQKAAAWLLKGKIKNELDKATQFPITDKIRQAQDQLDKTVDSYYSPYKMQVTAKLGEPDLPLFLPTSDKLMTTLYIDMYINVLFKDLSFFR